LKAEVSVDFEAFEAICLTWQSQNLYLRLELNCFRLMMPQSPKMTIFLRKMRCLSLKSFLNKNLCFPACKSRFQLTGQKGKAWTEKTASLWKNLILFLRLKLLSADKQML
jgi:hypothetical protein